MKRPEKKTFKPRLKVWKLKDQEAREKFTGKVCEGATGVAEAVGVNDKWEAMKKVWLTAVEDVCGWTKGPMRHEETKHGGGIKK